MHTQMELWAEYNLKSIKNIVMQEQNYAFGFVFWVGEAQFRDCASAVLPYSTKIRL